MIRLCQIHTFLNRVYEYVYIPCIRQSQVYVEGIGWICRECNDTYTKEISKCLSESNTDKEGGS